MFILVKIVGHYLLINILSILIKKGVFDENLDLGFC